MILKVLVIICTLASMYLFGGCGYNDQINSLHSVDDVKEKPQSDLSDLSFEDLKDQQLDISIINDQSIVSVDDYHFINSNLYSTIYHQNDYLDIVMIFSYHHYI